MASGNSTEGFNVLTQVITLFGPNGEEIPVPVDVIDMLYRSYCALQAVYGSQIGALLMVLAVYLMMTPSDKFRRIPTIINILALLASLVRCIMLAWFPSSQWFEFYTIFSGDISLVPASDYRLSVAATAMTIPVTILMEAALIVQAWAMIQLWPATYKLLAVCLSVLITTCAVGFKIADTVFLCLSIVQPGRPASTTVWIRKIDLAFSAASIFWFCCLFNVHIVKHMWTNRKILPSVKGMSAMEVLVVTNGILMLVPTLFAGLEYGPWAIYEFGSVTYTAVILVLPLGTLVAQRIANPSAFGSDGSARKAPSSGSNKEPFLKSWHNTTVSSRIESNSPGRSSVPDTGFSKYEGADLEKGVRVARQLEHTEHRDL